MEETKFLLLASGISIFAALLLTWRYFVIKLDF